MGKPSGSNNIAKSQSPQKEIAADVRFTLNSDRESGFPQKAMSSLPPKADVCGATRHVRFVPVTLAK
jgi:hypothetical protein